MRIKICGLTREEDAALAEKLGAWALGFILYPGSKRFIPPMAAKKIVAARRAPCVGVFVNQTDEALAVARDIRFKGLQLHGDETPDDCARAKAASGCFIVKALRPETEKDLEKIAHYADAVDYILIDAAVKGAYGGSGVTADWELAARAAGIAAELGVPLILAGGLDAGNIRAAAEKVPFFAADLAGGVESSPRVKDEGKMRELFEVAK